jgi:formylglycine-generating enzyme required for sulfatase activity
MANWLLPVSAAALIRQIDTGWHPLAQGIPPVWASGWGQDQYGVFAELSVAEVTQRLRWIPPGRFMMGSPEDEPGRYGDEGPQTEVTIGHGYWLFDTAVTQALWQAVMGENPSRFVSGERPVERVSWNDAHKFMAAMNERFEGLGLYLPSEAQWEYACRGGTSDATYAGPIEIMGENNAPILDAIAWYGGNSGVDFDLADGHDSSSWPEKQYPHSQAGTRMVRQKRPNAYGLYDMLGNVWEWCADIWRDSHEGIDADGAPRQSDSQPGEQCRVVRGGSWLIVARLVRAAYRSRNEPDFANGHLGFRCAAGQYGPEAPRVAFGPDGREAEPRLADPKASARKRASRR